MAMASTTFSPSQFQLIHVPKISIRSSSYSGYVTMKSISCCGISTSFKFQIEKCQLFTSLQTKGRDFGLKKLICEAGSGIEVSVADSEDSISVKKAEIVVESQDNDKIQVRVDLSGTETQRVFDKVLTNLAKTAPPIPGFRREKGGKTTNVPKSFLLGVIGEGRVTKFVLEEIVTSSIAQYVKKENLKVKEDKISTTQSADELKASFKPGSDFGFSAVIELQSSEVVKVETRNSEVEVSN